LAAVLAVALGLIWLPGEAWAACTPASPVNNADVTCTGTTTDQNAPVGYGTFADTGNTIAVVPGASVTGASDGIDFNSGTVTNSGSISGSNFGIDANTTATVSNSGIISGGSFAGIDANTTATVTNSGSISGGIFGIDAGTSATVTNSGTITGIGSAGISTTTANVTNSGTISSGTGDGIFARTANVTNSGTITGGTDGILANTTATVSNSGGISGGTFGIDAPTANVTNSGTITGGFLGIAATTANVSNSGTITGGFAGIDANTTATVSNSGTITGGADGIAAVSTATVSNSGTISGGSVAGVFAIIATVTNSGAITGGTFGIDALITATVTNSGTISGGTAALQFAGNPDTLTLLPGSHIIGAINLGGGGDTVNFRTGNQNLTFDTLAGATVTSTVPFVVSGNRVATIDPTPFAMSDRNLMDFSRAVSSAIPDIGGQSATQTAMAGTSSSALAFAGPGNNDSLFAGDFAAISGMASAYAGGAMPFRSPTVVYGDKAAVWARGFAGERVQQADGALLRTLNQFYGGMVGGDWQVRPDLRLGAFLGAGETRSSVDFNFGDTRSNLAFGGLFARYTWGRSFIDAVLQGGHSRNDSSRGVNNNLAPGGLETAKASFDGWYVDPQLTLGHHLALGALAGASYTLTPSLQVRYLHASFGGYTESGSTANLTVGTRTADDFEERGQLKLARTQAFSPAEALTTSIYGGVLGDQRAGDTTIDATLLGQAIPFATPDTDDVWGGFGGAGLEWRSGRVTLFASAEYLALSDSSTVVSGQGGVRVAF